MKPATIPWPRPHRTEHCPDLLAHEPLYGRTWTGTGTANIYREIHAKSFRRLIGNPVTGSFNLWFDREITFPAAITLRAPGTMGKWTHLDTQLIVLSKDYRRWSLGLAIRSHNRKSVHSASWIEVFSATHLRKTYRLKDNQIMMVWFLKAPRFT